MLRLVSYGPLVVNGVYTPAGTPFTIEEDGGNQLIMNKIAVYASPPKVFYETTAQEQDAQLREQGVTCLCLTRNRREWLKKAIACYRAQSYKPTELLIIADGVEVADLIPSEEPDIRLIHVEEGRNIGDKRNFGVTQARGKYIAHWDDDDWSAPDRLRDQCDRLRASGLPVTGYCQMDFEDSNGQWWRYHGERGYAPGSSLFYEKSWAMSHPFPTIQIGEDSDFVKDARQRKQVVSIPSNGMLTATIHPGNTSPRNTHGEMWSQLERSQWGLSVVIPSRTLSNVKPCVEAVQELNPDARIIVVDDGIENVESLNGVELVQGEKPFIFSRNVNIGIRAAGRDDVVILNDDAILKTRKGFFNMQLDQAMFSDFGIIGATTNAVGNRNQFPKAIGLRDEPRMICFICAYVPRRTLDAIGYLDERFTAYGFEDDDFCYRVRRAGLKIGIHDGCFVDHASLKSTFRGDALASGNLEGGRKIFEDKWGAYPL
jgi:Glycosyl transferase family 2